MTEKFLTTQEVADRLSITVRKVRILIYTKDDPLPALYMGKEYRIAEGELKRWMDGRRIRRQ
jgi:excisionase family DNA binding protein